MSQKHHYRQVKLRGLVFLSFIHLYGKDCYTASALVKGSTGFSLGKDGDFKDRESHNSAWGNWIYLEQSIEKFVHRVLQKTIWYLGSEQLRVPGMSMILVGEKEIRKVLLGPSHPQGSRRLCKCACTHSGAIKVEYGGWPKLLIDLSAKCGSLTGLRKVNTTSDQTMAQQ